MTKRELPEGRKPLTASESADLVKKMHEKLAAGFTAGDRIARLEELYEAALDDAKEAEAYAEELEARLARAEVIVRIIASDKWDERLGEAVDLSCEYLAELMGDEDDE
jgi:hypothetical protein